LVADRSLTCEPRLIDPGRPSATATEPLFLGYVPSGTALDEGWFQNPRPVELGPWAFGANGERRNHPWAFDPDRHALYYTGAGDGDRN
jgi:hypothetical protein